MDNVTRFVKLSLDLFDPANFITQFLALLCAQPKQRPKNVLTREVCLLRQLNEWKAVLTDFANYAINVFLFNLVVLIGVLLKFFILLAAVRSNNRLILDLV